MSYNRTSPKLRSYTVRRILKFYPQLDTRFIASAVGYGTFVDLKNKFLYVETPKAASTTVKHFLRHLCAAPPIKYTIGPLRESRRDMFIHVRENVPLPSLLDLNDKTQETVLHDPAFLRFCIVRNPYGRVLSAWENKIVPCEPGYNSIYEMLTGSIPSLERKSPPSFDAFLNFIEHTQDLRTCNPHWRLQLHQIFYAAIPYTHIGKLELLQDTLSTLQSHITSSTPLKIPDKNRSSHTTTHNPLNAQTAQTIYRLYRADFETFGYAAESWRQHISPDINKTTDISETRFLDEVTERNQVISYLYSQYASCYRFSLTRLRDILRRLF